EGKCPPGMFFLFIATVLTKSLGNVISTVSNLLPQVTAEALNQRIIHIFLSLNHMKKKNTSQNKYKRETESWSQ
ncbi:hypothetical protein ACQP3F_32450, partial [Escherichia coli]